MTLNFLGDFKMLKKCVSRTEVTGQWRDFGNQRQFCTPDGAVLNWWESTGTISFQGPKLAVLKLKGPFVRAALKKGLLADERDRGKEIADLNRQLEGALTEITRAEGSCSKELDHSGGDCPSGYAASLTNNAISLQAVFRARVVSTNLEFSQIVEELQFKKLDIEIVK
jgi:hypothetical protein